VNILISIIVFNYCKYLGRSIINSIQNKENFTEISDIKIKYFYPLVPIFIIGNFVLVINFLAPLKYIGIPILLAGSFMIFYDLKKNRIQKFQKILIIEDVLVPGILGISTYGAWLGWDTGLYHLPHQLMLREQTIVFGATNLNLWFGWSGLLEYVSSLFWLNDNWIAIRLIEIVFFTTFFNIVFYFISQNKNKFYQFSGIAILVFGFLDNFGYKGGGNGFYQFLTVGKYDSAVGLMFYLITLLIINEFIKDKYETQDFYSILLLSLFTVQIKQTGAYLLFLLLPYLVILLQRNKISFLSILLKIKFHIIILLIWLIKNIIISSCLFFPIEQTCLPFLSWHETVQIDFIQNTMRSLPVTLNSNLSILQQATDWFNWSKNDQFIINFPITLGILVLVFFALFKKVNIKKTSSKKLNYYFVLFLVINFIIWYISNYGNIRYGYGLWAIITSYIAFLFKDRQPRYSSKIFKKIFVIIFILTLIQLPRGYSYNSMISENFTFTAIQITKDKGTYFESKYGWGIYPDNILCWDEYDCKVIDKDVEPFKYLHTIIYYPDGIATD
jgi:hypothetical protein